MIKFKNRIAFYTTPDGNSDYYLVCTPTAKLRRSITINSVCDRGDYFGINLRNSKLTVIPGDVVMRDQNDFATTEIEEKPKVEFHFYYQDAWHNFHTKKYHDVMDSLNRYRNCTMFTCNSDPEVHTVHPNWDMFRLQLMEYYQKWYNK